MKGQFITLDGVDGAGKSSQLACIERWLQEHKLDYIITREPGGTKVGEWVRNYLLDVNTKVTVETETLLIFAARQQHLQEVIMPALNAGKWVLCDRFTEATFAYQGGGKGLAINKIKILKNWVQEGLSPNLTFILDAPLEISTQRVAKNTNKDRFENENELFFSRVRQTYLDLARINTQQYHVVESHQQLGIVSAQIEKILDIFLFHLQQETNQ